MGEEHKIKDAADAVKGLVQAVPVYQDALQPAAKEIGTQLQSVAKAVGIALAPLKALVWGYEAVGDFIDSRVVLKLRDVPPEKIVQPDLHVVGPVLDALKYAGHHEPLREMYANLLATSLDIDTCKNAHPAFVQMINSMSPDEAKIMRLFAAGQPIAVLDVIARDKKTHAYGTVARNFSLVGRDACCEHPALAPSYLDNLGRMGLIELPPASELARVTLADKSRYECLEQTAEVTQLKALIEDSGREMHLSRSVIELTELGHLFCQACVIDRAAHSPPPTSSGGNLP